MAGRCQEQANTGKCVKLILISPDIRIYLRLVKGIIAGWKQWSLGPELENSGLEQCSCHV